ETAGIEVEEELAGLRVPAPHAVAGDHPIAVPEDAEAGERTIPELAAQRAERTADATERHVLGEQRACGAEEPRVEEVEAQASMTTALRRDQAGPHALSQAAGGKAHDARGLRGVETCLRRRPSPRRHATSSCRLTAPPAALRHRLPGDVPPLAAPTAAWHVRPRGSGSASAPPS